MRDPEDEHIFYMCQKESENRMVHHMMSCHIISIVHFIDCKLFEIFECVAILYI